jgi:GNAT superfamily N-acetyltransferase
VEASPDEATVKTIGKGLDDYNEQFAPGLSFHSHWVVGRDGEGTVQAGIRHVLLSESMLVEWLWVASPRRRSGVGSQLLAQAEAHARKTLCTKAYLDTISFQAPRFYERHGYEEFARLPGFPTGSHSRIWLWKEL